MGQAEQSFKKEITKSLKINYLLYLPKDYEESEDEWPLILFLHGLGECGDDLEKVKVHGPPKLIEEEGKEFPFIIVSPQCPEGSWWPTGIQIDTLNALLDEIVSQFRVDVN